MADKWDRAKALLGGTTAMRAAGKVYLPQYEAETDKQWGVRKDRAVVTPFYKAMKEAMVGHVFSKPLQIQNSKIDERLLSDIDKQGNSLNRFARQAFDCGMEKGYCHIFVNYPPVPEDATVATIKEANVRPYWTFIPPDNMIDTHIEVVDGEERLVHARWFELSEEVRGFQVATIRRIHVVEIGFFQVFRENADGQWALEREGEISLDYIPLKTIYLHRKGKLISNPPLDAVTHLNVEHWQSASDQRNILTLSRFAMLAQTGGEKPATLETGPRVLLWCSDPSAKFAYIEPNGKGIEAGEKDLDRILSAAQLVGFDLMTKQPGSETATGRLIDSVRVTSPLQDMGQALEDGINECLRYTADWLALDPDKAGTVVINQDYGFSSDERAILEQLDKARARGDLTQRTFLLSLQEHGVLSEDIDVDEEIAAIEDEDDGLGLNAGLANAFEIPAGLPAPDEEDGEDDADDE
jgi:hypothetical protein